MITTPQDKKIHFGASGFEDYTMHKNDSRKNNYINRHQVNEDFSKKGINKAGFWARWILWNKPTLEDSIKDAERRFNIKIVYQ